MAERYMKETNEPFIGKFVAFTTLVALDYKEQN